MTSARDERCQSCQLSVRVAVLQNRVYREAGIRDALPRPLQQGPRIRCAVSAEVRLLHVRDDHPGFEAQAQMDGLFQRFVGIGTAVQTYKQAREHSGIGTRCSGEHREALQITQVEGEQLAGHG